MKDDEIYALFNPLWEEIPADALHGPRPLLAHYTSTENLEKILANDEIWFSNPLLMNDMEELRLGINLGLRMFQGHAGIKAICDREDRYQILATNFYQNYQNLDNDHAYDIYALCLTEHDPNDMDGLLSMWRGYGGNGKGAALVFDSSQIPFVETSPFVFSRVEYLTTRQRESWITALLDQFAAILGSSDIRDDKLHLAAHALFERIKIFSLFTKHRGFSEEREWRVVYLKDRDRENRLHSMFSYTIGPAGIEPKLKFKVGPIDGVTGGDLSLDTLIDRIIIGPSGSSALEIHAIKRMLESINKAELANKIAGSTTPFRVI